MLIFMLYDYSTGPEDKRPAKEADIIICDKV
mgnify:CR=1 FL=1